MNRKTFHLRQIEPIFRECVRACVCVCVCRRESLLTFVDFSISMCNICTRHRRHEHNMCRRAISSDANFPSCECISNGWDTTHDRAPAELFICPPIFSFFFYLLPLFLTGSLSLASCLEAPVAVVDRCVNGSLAFGRFRFFSACSRVHLLFACAEQSTVSVSRSSCLLLSILSVYDGD